MEAGDEGGEGEQEEDVWDADTGIPYEETANEKGLGNRIALNKMDWDSISAVDLLALFQGLCSGEKVVHKVEIFPSLFGLERMKQDALHGPPKEIFDPGEEDMKKKRGYRGKKKQEDSADSSDEIMDMLEAENNPNSFNQERLRKYEIEKMKYYYAVIYCNSAKTAIFLYDEYNGYEFENTNICLNMSLIPEEIKFT